ncbi:ATP-dependent DNA helicase RecQ [Bacteroidia bacterium]|nr:ATP-dependent DNA helicase RecQ [Bacteroidia bacterium]
MAKIHDILKQYWGYDSFRPLQEDIISSVLSGNDALALLPTGGGKSICFQIPALATDGMCIVVSPLIALMKDQVENLQKRGIPAACLCTGMSQNEMSLTLDQAVDGDLKFLYVSPERLETNAFKVNVPNFNINLLAIDEAHCISQFGYDFRPPYLNIAAFRALIPNVTCLALTATATPEVVTDIQEKLDFKKKKVFQSSFARNNLIYYVFKEENKYGRMLNIIRKMQGSGIVYVRNRRKTKEVADFLNKQGISADYYNAGLDSKTRSKAQSDWIEGRTQVIVATNAFGMGIDKPDCRFVIHIDLADSVEGYFQEAGRGGRDGKKAAAVVLFDEKDKAEIAKNYEKSYPKLDYIRNVYEALCNFYKIPVGSGLDAGFDFDLNKFCDSYKLETVLAYNSLKFIEKQGLISLSENINNPSAIRIKVAPDEIYQLQIQNPVYTIFLDTLLRSYSGLYSNFVKINELQLAKKMHFEISEVIYHLQKLEKLGVLDYNKATGKPKIIFSTERRNAFYLDNEFYKDRKDNAKRMLDAMLHYVDSVNRCRSTLLLDYFGEKNAVPCGECDVCLAKHRNKKKELEEYILDVLADKLLSSDEIIVALRDFQEKAIAEKLRELRDSGKVFVNEFGLFGKTH